MSDPSLATSADYADALLVARRAKNWLFLLILLMLLLQIALFFVARYTNVLPVESSATTRPVREQWLNYITGFTIFFGTVLPIVLSLVLLIIVHVMLVGRLIGVSRVTSAYIWCLLLILLMFPYQVFFGGSSDPSDFRWPGVLYTWSDLVTYAKFDPANLYVAVTKWARFFVLPLAAVVLLLVTQIKSNRGLRQALGEASPDLGANL
jgi:hypothetical protein